MTNFRIAYLLALAQAIAGQDATSPVRWTLPSDASNAQAVYKGYIGFGIEMKSFPDYTGTDTPNQFSNYLLSLLADRTGNAPIHIRVGGTSMDSSIYDPSFNETWKKTPQGKDCRLHTQVTLGKPWVEKTFGNLNSSFTRYTIDVPLARLNKTNGIEFANACINAMPSKTSQLDAVEIGNEPNLYTSFPNPPCATNDRPSGWNASDYSRQWTTYAKNLTDNVQALKNSGRKDWFQTLALSSGYKVDDWTFADFWDQLKQDGYIKTISQHYYQTDAKGSVTDYPIAHANTVNVLETKFRRNLNFTKNRNMPFILGEVGTVVSSSNANSESQDLYNSLGSALWTFDFLLYGMSMGINRVSMQMATGFKISAWKPAKGKEVHGSFYGLVAGAEFIGEGEDLQIQALSTQGHENIAGYAGFSGGKLAKVAVLNLHFWNETNATLEDRPKRNIALGGLGNDVSSVRVSTLTASNGTPDHNITWAGKRWTAEGDGKEYQSGPKPVVIDVRNGAPVRNLTVGASEAVLVEIVRN